MIDTSNWKDYVVGELFYKLDLKCKKEQFSKALDCSEIPTAEFSLPLTNAKHFNNGIQFYGRPEDWESAEMTIDIVSNGAIATGDVYAQPQRTGVLWDSYLIKCVYEIKSEYVLQFMACVIERCVKQFFAWNDKCTWDRVKERTIKLPSTSDGKPDWVFMDSYMKRIMKESEEILENLRRAKSSKHIIDVSEWKEFSITDFFDLSLPKGDLQVKKVEEGDIMLITPSNSNNGLLQRISADSKSTRYKANSLTVDMFGNAYYHAEDFFVTAHGHVNVLLPKVTINEYTGKFIATAIRTMFLDKYGFSEMCTLKVLKAESIRLPVTRKGDPDWQYMEDYMKDIIKQAEESLSALKIGA